MDLGTVQQKVEEMAYEDVPKQFPADCRLVFDNALAYNDEGDPIWGYAKELRGVFDQLWYQVVGSESAQQADRPAKGKESAEARDRSDKKMRDPQDYGDAARNKKPENRIVLVLPNKRVEDKTDNGKQKRTDKSVSGDADRAPYTSERSRPDQGSRRLEREIKKPKLDLDDEPERVPGQAKRRLSGLSGDRQERTPGGSRSDRYGEDAGSEVKVKRIKLVVVDGDDDATRESKQHKEQLLVRFPVKKPGVKESPVAETRSPGKNANAKATHSSEKEAVIDVRREQRKPKDAGREGTDRDVGAGILRPDLKQMNSKEPRSSGKDSAGAAGGADGKAHRAVRDGDRCTPQTERGSAVLDAKAKEEKDWRAQCQKLLVRLMNTKVREVTRCL
jgi:hypothetical protein